MIFVRKKKSVSLPSVRRRAGQSLREKRDSFVDDRLFGFVVCPLVVWVFFVSQASQAWFHSTPAPRFWLAIAIVTTGICAILILRLISKAKRLVRGERGELKVGEVLDELRAWGYRVFHDLQRDGFNIDHAIVGPAGVFAIETKFRSGHGEIEFRNGEGLFVRGVAEEKDSLKQARGNARELNKLIREHCGIYEWVKPLVVFVGDWKVKDRWRDTDVRVLTTEQLVRYFDRQQPNLTRKEIDLIASHLERSGKGE
jgi:hypothetical protein